MTPTPRQGTITQVDDGPGRRRALLRDAVPVLLLAALSTAALVAVRDGDAGAGELVLSVLLWVPALARRRLPLPAFGVTALIVAAHWLATGLDAESSFLFADWALLFLLAGIAERCSTRWTVAAALVCEGFALATLAGTYPADGGHPVVPLSALTVAAALFGRNRRVRRELLADLRDRAERAERERDQQARVAVAEERTRIAREVHDVVSHNLSVMTALADGAGYAMRSDTGQQQARDAVAQVAATGREALAEMHRLLGVLRHDDDAAAGDPAEPPRRPAPGLADLPSLVEQVRAAGLPTTLTVTGAPHALGTAAQLAVYRLVQEALTNTLTHAPGATRATVDLHWSTAGLAVSVRDDGPGAPPSDRVGHGLIGMRERVGAHGGSVAAGPHPAGGWLVAARLPLPAALPTAAAPA